MHFYQLYLNESDNFFHAFVDLGYILYISFNKIEK